MKRATVLTVTVVAVLAATPSSSLFAADDEEGRQVYDQACAACHQADARGIPGAFPPLAANPNVADPAYVEQTIRNGLSGPITVLGETYDGTMAPIATLSDEQITAVVAYVTSLAGEAPTPPPTTAAPPSGGDAAVGEALFLGSAVFDEGGPACAACHAAGGFDVLGGSGLGPDLTDMYSRFGGSGGVMAALAAPPSATMTPLFADRPLTDGEVRDLTAFFADVDGSDSGGFDYLWLWALAGVAALFAFIGLFVSKPKGTYVEKLRSTP